LIGLRLIALAAVGKARIARVAVGVQRPELDVVSASV
jgi:hypothetical protein